MKLSGLKMFLTLMMAMMLIGSCHYHLKIEKRKFRQGLHIEFSCENDRKSSHETSKEYADKRVVQKDLFVIISNQDTLNPSERKDKETTASVSKKNHLVFSTYTAQNYFFPERKQMESKNPSPKKAKAGKKFKSIAGFQSFYPSILSGMLLFLGFLTWKGITQKKAAIKSRWARKNRSRARRQIAFYHLSILLSAFGISQTTQGIEFGPLREIALVTIFSSLLSGSFNEMFSKNKVKRSAFRKMAGSFLSFGGFLLSLHLFKGEFFKDHLNLHTDGQLIILTILKVLLTLSLLALAAFSFAGIASIACDLSCSGYYGLALIVFTGGNFLIAFLSILGLSHLWKKKLMNEEDKKAQNQKITKYSLLVSIILALIGTLLLFIV